MAKQKGGRVWVRRCALASLVATSAAYLLEGFVAEDSWFSMLVLHFPQWPFAAVPLLVGVWAVWSRDRLPVWCSAAGFGVGILLCTPSWRGPNQGAIRADRTLRVITFNVQGCRGGPNRIAALLRREDPDIVAFQEASFLNEGDTRAEIVADALPGFHWFRHGNLAIASRWRIEKRWASDFKVPTHIWAIFAEVRWKGDAGPPIVVGATHLNPVHWDRFLPSEIGKLPDHLRTTGRIRERQALELTRELEKVERKVPTILCGDFNGPPRGRVYNRLTRNLKDSFAESASGFGWTIPSAMPMMRLDYVFVSHQSTAVRSRVLDDAGSDHRALLAEIAP